jgi:hypothetical protein
MGLGGVPYQPPTMKVQYTGKTASCDRLKGGESLRLIVQYHANSERTLESLFFREYSVSKPRHAGEPYRMCVQLDI